MIFEMWKTYLSKRRSILKYSDGEYQPPPQCPSPPHSHQQMYFSHYNTMCDVLNLLSCWMQSLLVDSFLPSFLLFFIFCLKEWQTIIYNNSISLHTLIIDSRLMSIWVTNRLIDLELNESFECNEKFNLKRNKLIFCVLCLMKWHKPSAMKQHNHVPFTFMLSCCVVSKKNPKFIYFFFNYNIFTRFSYKKKTFSSFAIPKMSFYFWNWITFSLTMM